MQEVFDFLKVYGVLLCSSAAMEFVLSKNASEVESGFLTLSFTLVIPICLKSPAYFFALTQSLPIDLIHLALTRRHLINIKVEPQ